MEKKFSGKIKIQSIEQTSFVVILDITTPFTIMNSLLDVLMLLLINIPVIFCKRCGCYNNASLINLPNATLYNNLTLQSCQCLFSQQSRSSFQYNSSDQTCHICDYDIAAVNLRVALGCQVCFCNQTTTVSYT